MHELQSKLVNISADDVNLEGSLNIPERSKSIVLFAHGSGSSRFSPRNNYVASVLQKSGLATLLIDLLTEQEDQVYETRFDIDLLTKRLIIATKWLRNNPPSKDLSIGYFGASTGAAAALQAAAKLGAEIKAIVSRGGRPDLAKENLKKVQAPTLLLVGGNDTEVIKLNQIALDELKTTCDLVIVPGATHLFEEPGTLEKVAQISAKWFKKYL
ncbi:MAG: dienelactone hydrolase family protein [bacterium]|nr:dienelactone hydrolase family protein [bacterium]